MFMKQSSYYGARHAEQNGVLIGWGVYHAPSACKEQCEFESTILFIQEMRLFGEEEEGVWWPKGVYFDKFNGDF